MSEKDEALILLKSLGCKQPTIFHFWFNAEQDKGWAANTDCSSCEKEKSLTRMTFHSLAPKIVVNPLLSVPLKMPQNRSRMSEYKMLNPFSNTTQTQTRKLH